MEVNRRIDHGVPILDENSFEIEFPQSWDEDLQLKFQLWKYALNDWMIKRQQTIFELNKIADKLDAMEKGCAITTTVGSSVGIAGGVAAITGLLVAPPVAVAGFVTGAVAAAVNCGVRLGMVLQFKKQAKLVTNLVEEDKWKTEKMQQLFDEFFEVFKSRVDSDPQFANSTANFKNFASAGAACGNIAGLILKQSARISVTMMRTAAHAAAAVGIVFDIISLVISTKSLAKGATSEMATSIRRTSDGLNDDYQDVQKLFSAFLAPRTRSQ